MNDEKINVIIKSNFYVNVLTITLSSLKVISDETLSSWEPFNFLLVRDGRTFSIFGLFAAVYNKHMRYLRIKHAL